jgi:hydroxymethylpyrimidine pyrophosphatase-like HAD family hydrolase
MESEFQKVKQNTATYRTAPDECQQAGSASGQADDERSFYLHYRWALNPFPTAHDVIGRLQEELARAQGVDEGWRGEEVLTNIFLLSCALTDTLDDYLLGKRYNISKLAKLVPTVRVVAGAADRLLEFNQRCRERRLNSLLEWRQSWAGAVEDYLIAVETGCWCRDHARAAAVRLQSLLGEKFPYDFLRRIPRIPGAFRKQDLTHHDILALGRKFVQAFPNRCPLWVIGLRTAGSYFAPLLTAFLRAQGFRDVTTTTLRPKRGVASWEATRLAHCAAAGCTAVVVDESVGTGRTVGKSVETLIHAGIPERRIVLLLPVHPVRRRWCASGALSRIPSENIVRLEPDEWRKRQLLEPKAVETYLRRYFDLHGHSASVVSETEATERYNAELSGTSAGDFSSRLKRIFELRLDDEAGVTRTKYVLAKSVGWGWFSYHAFLAAHELAQFVPPVYGLRDGVLYMEWLPSSGSPDRSDGVIRAGADYVAARAQRLGLQSDPAPKLTRAKLAKGFDMLADALSGAYGSKPAAMLAASRIRSHLSLWPAPCPTLIDGQMRREEWLSDRGTLLKSDFEHHGLGRSQLNATDPAYDLSDFTLSFNLSQQQESELIERYVEQSSDTGVRKRLFLYKLMAGTARMRLALAGLTNPEMEHQHAWLNQQYVQAWNFLTVQTVRFCGSLCRKPSVCGWRPRLASIDLDGVLDRRFLGFPSTTVAGMQAVSLLHAHDISIAVNTARTLPEVMEYCDSYGFVGGVAEYGSVVWDAVNGREQVLVDAETLQDLETLGCLLRKEAGVFIDDRYRYSIRAYRYACRSTVPAPSSLVNSLVADLKTDRLSVRETTLDTAITAKRVDKGKGLGALLALAGRPGLDTVAVGDSEPDLAMFRAAKRSFAPGNILCRAAAEALGCRVVRRSFQRGLLDIARLIANPNGGRCERPWLERASLAGAESFILGLLKTADNNRWALLMRALLDPMAMDALLRSE